MRAMGCDSADTGLSATRLLSWISSESAAAGRFSLPFFPAVPLEKSQDRIILRRLEKATLHSVYLSRETRRGGSGCFFSPIGSLNT